jgi:uncharacterized membrane protein
MSAPPSIAAARPAREVLTATGTPPGGQRWTRAERLWVFALVALVAGLTSWHLGAPTFWNDEAATWAIAGHGFRDLLHVLATSGGDRGAALYYLVAFAWMRVLGTSEVALRSLSVVAATVAIVPFHAIARRVVSRPAAWAAGLIFATSSFLVTYARDARTYSFALCFVLLAAWTFLRAIESRRPRDWWVFVGVALLAIAAHWFSALIVVSLYVSLACWRRPLGALLRPVFLSGVALAVGVLPIAVQLAVGANSGLGWVAPLNAAELRAVVEGFTGTTAPVVQLAIGAVAGAGFVVAWSERAARRVPPVVVTWFVMPVIAAIAVSEIKPVLVARYLIVALPGFTLLLGLGVAIIARGRILAAVACSAVVAVLGLHGFAGLWSSSRGGEDWRSIVASVSARARPTDAVVVFPATAVSAYSYYARDQERIAGRDGPTWPAVDWNSPFNLSIANSTVLRSDLTHRSGVWLVVRAPHGGTVAHGVQESPVLSHLEHQLAAAYRAATVVTPWNRHDTVYVIHYSDSAGP